MNQYYMLSVHSTDDEPPKPMTDEEMRQGHALVAGLEAEMKAAGAFVFSGRLDHPDRARVVRASRGRVRSTDGPFAETKEHLGGFYLITAPDAEAALEWASKVTQAIKVPIEVRPLAGGELGR
jgi:hypothetical protein